MGYVITVLAILGIIIIVLEWLWNVTKAVASSIWHLMKNIAHVLWLPLVIALIIVILWQVINRLIEKRVSVKSDICRRLKELLEEAQQLPKPMNMDLTSQPLKVSAGELPEEIFFIEKHSEIQKQIDLVMNNRQQCASIREKYYCILQEYEEQVKEERNIPFEKYVVTRYTRKITNKINNMPDSFSATVAFVQYNNVKKVQYSFNEIVNYNSRYDELVKNLENRKRVQREREEEQRRRAEQERKEEAEREAAKKRAEERRKEEIKRERAKMSASLRYDVMKRDHFRCTICGRSADDGVTLHVDHIKPVSKGGKTEMSNLRTLCDYCNLGKSDKYDPSGMN